MTRFQLGLLNTKSANEKDADTANRQNTSTDVHSCVSDPRGVRNLGTGTLPIARTNGADGGRAGNYICNLQAAGWSDWRKLGSRKINESFRYKTELANLAARPRVRRAFSAKTGRAIGVHVVRGRLSKY
jgi:hypothetical protein